MIDIVFPQDNEKKFIDMAIKLGYDSLCLVYPLKNFHKEKTKAKDIKVFYGCLCAEKEVRKARRLADVVLVKSSKSDRNVIEKIKPDIVFDFETDARKDYIHQRNSGLNHIMCRFAHENNVRVGFSFNSVLSSDRRYLVMGRMMQNIRLCRKYKVKMVLASFAQKPYEMRAASELKSFGIVLGMHPKEAKEALNRKIYK